MRHPLDYLRRGRVREFLSLQLVVGGKTAMLFVNPLMLALLVIYLFFHGIVVNAYHTLYPMPILYMGAICLVFGNFMYTYIHLIGCMKRGQYHLVKWTLLIPLYWMLASVAGYIALYQIVFKPHHWEKTLHGLHLQKSRSSSRFTVVTQAGELELIATRSFSSISLTADDLELEIKKQSLHLKVRTGEHPAIQKHRIIPSTIGNGESEAATIAEGPAKSTG